MNRSAHPNNKALKALGVAITESRRLRNSWIGPEHILLGLIADDEGTVAEAISHEGLSPKELRKATKSAIVRSKTIAPSLKIRLNLLSLRISMFCVMH